jgi:hypothetical protein
MFDFKVFSFKYMSSSNSIKRLLPVFIFLLTTTVCFSQKVDSTKHTLNFRGTVTATNNGFSLVPTFSLGKPALMTNLSLSGKGRMSFEPMFWYSMLDFKPWSFIFVWRYKVVKREKFTLAIGTHLPAVNFRTTAVVQNNVTQDMIEARRFFPVAEVMPGYRFNRHFSFNAYILYGKGLDKSASAANTFVSLRPDVDHIRLSEKFFLRLNPQFYYLKINKTDGFYTAASLTLAHRTWPFSVSTMVNKALKTNITTADFDWNVGLTYAFGRSFVEK